jgi:hypothetical protein
MSSVGAPLLQTVVFADLDSGLWGVAWGSPDGSLGIGQLQSGSATTGTETSFDGADASEDWRLAGEAGELTMSPLSDPVSSAPPDGFDQLCEVQGHLVPGAEQTVRGLGIRTARTGIDPAAVQSLRHACVWFAPDDGLVLTALRPAGARGHDRDLVVGSVFEPSGGMPVADPRLSTTYAADGAPARAGLELGIQAEDDEADYPRRAAGETIGPQVTLSADGFDLRAHAMRWQSRGRDGIGAYVLAQPR